MSTKPQILVLSQNHSCGPGEVCVFFWGTVGSKKHLTDREKKSLWHRWKARGTQQQLKTWPHLISLHQLVRGSSQRPSYPLVCGERLSKAVACTLFSAPLQCPGTPCPAPEGWAPRRSQRQEAGCCARLPPTGAPTSAHTRSSGSNPKPFPSRERCFDLGLGCFGVGWNLLNKQNCSQTGGVGLTPQTEV